jgi:hypothetical protein
VYRVRFNVLALRHVSIIIIANTVVDRTQMIGSSATFITVFVKSTYVVRKFSVAMSAASSQMPPALGRAAYGSPVNNHTCTIPPKLRWKFVVGETDIQCQFS